MQRRTKWIVGAAAAAVLAGGGSGFAVATNSGDDDGTERPISGPALERASDAALDHTGGGRVTGTEAGDEEGAYEVEVTLPSGEQTDVHLDRHFDVIGTETDSGDDGEE
jgi:hypothetical protein